jgi:hypothetical protein
VIDRVDGRMWINSARTPANGGNTLRRSCRWRPDRHINGLTATL